MILKQKDEISVLQVEQLWIDLNSQRQKMTLVNPISASGEFSKVPPESHWLRFHFENLLSFYSRRIDNITIRRNSSDLES